MQIFNDKLVFLLSGFQSWVVGVTIFPFVFSKEKMRGSTKHLNHERIHLRQELECLLVIYPIIYYLHYGYNRLKGMDHMEAYRNICFEKEAYGNQGDVSYLKNRIAEIKGLLSNIDTQTVRPLRAKIAGTATTIDENKLSELEAEAVQLRVELKNLE